MTIEMLLDPFPTNLVAEHSARMPLPERESVGQICFPYNWIACGVCSIIVWFADNVPPLLCSTSACAVQIQLFPCTTRACYVTFGGNAMKQYTHRLKTFLVSDVYALV